MKKLAFALAVSALATTAGANDGNGFSGFYVGGNVGYGTTDTKASGTFFTVQNSASVASKGVLGGLQVGYGKQFVNNFYTGLEATGTLAGNKGHANTSQGNNNVSSVSVKRSNAFGLHIRPGYVVGNSLISAKVGIESATFKSSFSSISGVRSFTGSSSGRQTGFVVGGGIDTKVADHVIVGVQGTQTFYKSFSTGVESFKPQATDVVARISYLW
jgi:outer membrane immunogenic protein